jgi:hypothetical integral membrane protein (TIGR02206 family)
LDDAPGFRHFDLAHWAALATIPAVAALLAFLSWRSPRLRTPLGRALAVALLVLEIAWFFRVRSYGVPLTQLLPLQLSDASILLAVFVGWALHQFAFDVLYYWALTAIPLAMLTPDLREPFPALDTVLFFFLHGLVVVIVLYLLWSGSLRPRPGSMWRSFGVLNAFMLFVLAANWLLGTNYMYLMQKPSQPSPLDYMGPWPVYILVGEVVALVAFYVLRLPFARGSADRGDRA